MAAERGYVRLTASRTMPVLGERQGAVQPDPILDSPVPLAPQEEVYVRPFVRVEGEPRGTQFDHYRAQAEEQGANGNAKFILPPETIDDAPRAEQCVHPHSHDTGIRGLLEHVGIDTSRGISVDGEMVAEPCVKPLTPSLKDRVLGIDHLILKDQMDAHRAMWEGYVDQRVEALNHNRVKIMTEVHSMILGHIAEGLSVKRLDYVFSPLEMEDSGLSFTDFAHAVVEGYRRGYPEVKDYRFSVQHGRFEDAQEIFVVEEIVKVTPDTLKDIKSGDQLEITFPKGVRKPENGILRDVQAAFRQQHPDHVMVSVTDIQEHEDGSATLTVEGQSLVTVQPLSGMETAQHTE